jgi:hypothetical protein
MTTVRLTMTSTLSPSELMSVLTDFTASRPDVWSTVDADHFEVHAIGDTWAEVTEGTASAWERARYDWDLHRRRVVVTTHDSKVFGPGGGWVFQLTPQGPGTRIDVELTRRPAKLLQKFLASLLPLVAPKALKKSLSGPLRAK